MSRAFRNLNSERKKKKVTAEGFRSGSQIQVGAPGLKPSHLPPGQDRLYASFKKFFQRTNVNTLLKGFQNVPFEKITKRKTGNLYRIRKQRF